MNNSRRERLMNTFEKGTVLGPKTKTSSNRKLHEKLSRTVSAYHMWCIFMTTFVLVKYDFSATIVNEPINTQGFL